MPTNILYLGYAEQQYSGSYAFIVTTELDADYRKYLLRKLNEYLPPMMIQHPPDAQLLDISMDDVEGDVVAGISAATYRGTLYLDMLWVDEPMRGQGIGHRLVQMAEEQARERQCVRARVQVATPGAAAYFAGLGYAVNGAAQLMPAERHHPTQHAVYWLVKELSPAYIPVNLA
jgi:GNAT superfamily N-acetyltransferase